jgi:GrpB-like predicted nucleotidyltransferase (UPF0157 family)
MKRNLHSLSREELGKLFPIEIVSFRGEWKNLFLAEERIIRSILQKESINRIEHYGSTSVPGLNAKPIIDILVEIPDDSATGKRIINEFTSHGYNYMTNLTDHIMVVKGYTENGYCGQAYHIHCAPEGNKLWDGIFFRDYLIEHPDTAREYETLKAVLAEKFKYDRDAYTEAKTEFIMKITNLAKNSGKFLF